jgi:hypothetical protein
MNEVVRDPRMLFEGLYLTESPVLSHAAARATAKPTVAIDNYH